MSERDKQIQEQCGHLSHYEPHHAIQQDVISALSIIVQIVFKKLSPTLLQVITVLGIPAQIYTKIYL